jgi:hypothetical protein
MSSRNIWNNTSKNNIQTINKKNLKFILEGQTTTDDQLILKFISSSPIILTLHGYQNNDNINDSTYFKMMLDDDSFEYTTTYKNPIIDIVKDLNINNNKFHIKNTKTNFYYLVEMFSKNDIIISTTFKLTYQ